MNTHFMNLKNFINLMNSFELNKNDLFSKARSDPAITGLNLLGRALLR